MKASTSLSRLFFGLLFAFVFFLPTEVSAIVLENNDLEIFTINLPTNLSEDIDEDSGEMILSTGDRSFVFSFSPFGIDENFDLVEALGEAIDEMEVEGEIETFSINAGGEPFFGTVLESNEGAILLGYLADFKSGVGVFMFFVSQEGDITSLMEIASSMRVKRYN